MLRGKVENWTEPQKQIVAGEVFLTKGASVPTVSLEMSKEKEEEWTKELKRREGLTFLINFYRFVSLVWSFSAPSRWLIFPWLPIPFNRVIFPPTWVLGGMARTDEQTHSVWALEGELWLFFLECTSRWPTTTQVLIIPGITMFFDKVEHQLGENSGVKGLCSIPCSLLSVYLNQAHWTSHLGTTYTSHINANMLYLYSRLS